MSLNLNNKFSFTLMSSSSSFSVYSQYRQKTWSRDTPQVLSKDLENLPNTQSYLGFTSKPFNLLPPICSLSYSVWKCPNIGTSPGMEIVIEWELENVVFVLD